MKKIFLTMALAIGLMASAQVKIGTAPETIDANSLLELETTNQGLLFPRVALVSTTSYAPLNSTLPNIKQPGMTVYNTATANDVTPGLYVNDGTNWVRLGGSTFVSATLTKDNTYTTLNLSEVIPNNITTITFYPSAPSAIAILDLPAGPSYVGKILNLYTTSGNISYTLKRAGDGTTLSGQTISSTFGGSFVWDGIGWAKISR